MSLGGHYRVVHSTRQVGERMQKTISRLDGAKRGMIESCQTGLDMSHIMRVKGGTLALALRRK
jgi:hypothetical protein